MKTYITTLVTAFASAFPMVPVQASSYDNAASEVCAVVADGAVNVAWAGANNIPWSRIEHAIRKLDATNPAEAVGRTLFRDAFYNYAGMDDKLVRQLTYTRCLLLIEELR